MSVLLVSRTLWSEPPRLRHQVARLLIKLGHEVLFLERPGLTSRPLRLVEKGLWVGRPIEPVHHQLRFSTHITAASHEVTRRSVANLVSAHRVDAVANFNYDAWYLRELYPSTRLVTFINDSFVARSRSYARHSAEQALARTVASSDAAAAVSYGLLAEISAWNSNAELFLPWADRSYSRPTASGTRNGVFYWGYINYRLDIKAVNALQRAGVHVHFAGPVEDRSILDVVLQGGNATYHGVGSLEVFAHVVSQCYGALLAYDLSRWPDAATVTNRSFSLLARGLPLLCTAFSGLLTSPQGVIVPCRTPEDFVAAAQVARSSFESVQPAIEDFLREHGEASRRMQLSRLLGLEAR